MKILLCTGLYPPEIGGPATYAKLLENELPKHGIEVEVLKFSDVRHLPKILRHVSFFLKIISRGRHTDLIFVQDTVSTGLPSALAARFLRKPLIVRVPGDYAWEQGRQRFGVTDSLEVFQTRRYGLGVEFLRFTQQFVARSANIVIAPSNYLSAIIRNWNIKNVRMIYNGVELPIKVTKPSDFFARPLIVSIGRLVSWKGFNELIEVVSNEPNWRLKIIGDGPEKSNLEKLIRQKNLAERVELLGNLPRQVALGWASAADVFTLYSSYEGLSHTLVEVASLGVPIVAGDIAGNREVIENEKSGLLVPLNDNKKLHAALKRMINNPLESKKFGTVSATASENFSFIKTAEKTAAIIKELCAS